MVRHSQKDLHRSGTVTVADPKVVAERIPMWNIVRELALSFDGVEEGTSYGTPAFRVKGKLFVRWHQDEETLIVRMDFDRRDHFIELDPSTFFTTDHYRRYEWLLVRLSTVDSAKLRDLLRISWSMCAPKKPH